MMLKLKPALKDYLWGGKKLKTDFHFETNLQSVAEGWMLSCHKDGESIVADGDYQEMSLSSIVDAEGKAILGTHAQQFDFFPILIKLIDAEKDLSVQVHPDDEYALRVEGEYGKTECWYILDCDEDAELIYGFKQPISCAEFRDRIADNTFLDVVNRVKVKPGELYFIEAGTLHAIGKGILLAEIQQNSNTTYRVYDYNRVGADGKLRPLHIDKAVDVTHCAPPAHSVSNPPLVEKNGYSHRLLVSSALFQVCELVITTEAVRTADETSFVSLLVTDGSGCVQCGEQKLEISKGDSVFISANSGAYRISGGVKILETRI